MLNVLDNVLYFTVYKKSVSLGMFQMCALNVAQRLEGILSDRFTWLKNSFCILHASCQYTNVSMN